MSIPISYADTGNLDAFSRLRTSEPYNVWDSTFQYNLQPNLFDVNTNGAGAVSHLINESSASLSVSANGDYAILQSNRYIRYQPGKSQFIIMTGVLGSSVADITTRIGYFDDDDGLYFEQSGSGLSVVRRTSTSGAPVNNSVSQNSWNLDPMDGNGPSGIVLDPTKDQIFMIDFEWLGAGRVRMGVNISGIIYYVHEFLNANILTTVYMKTGNLPVRYEIRSTGGSGTMQATCTSVSSEGGSNPIGFSHAVQTLTGKAVSTTEIPILSLRSKSTFNGQVNRGLSRLTRFEFVTDNVIAWKLRYNPTLTGASFASVDSNSLLEYDISATSFTGGEIIDCGYAGSGKNVSSLLIQGLNLEKFYISLNSVGTQIPFTITVQVLSTNSSTYISASFVDYY